MNFADPSGLSQAGYPLAGGFGGGSTFNSSVGRGALSATLPQQGLDQDNSLSSPATFDSVLTRPIRQGGFGNVPASNSFSYDTFSSFSNSDTVDSFSSLNAYVTGGSGLSAQESRDLERAFETILSPSTPSRIERDLRLTNSPVRCIACHNPVVMYGDGDPAKLPQSYQRAMQAWLRTDNPSLMEQRLGTMRSAGSFSRNVVSTAAIVATGGTSWLAAGGAGAFFGGVEYATTGDAGQAVDHIPLVSLRHVPEQVGTVFDSSASAGERGLAGVSAVLSFAELLGLRRVPGSRTTGASSRSDALTHGAQLRAKFGTQFDEYARFREQGFHS